MALLLQVRLYTETKSFKSQHKQTNRSMTRQPDTSKNYPKNWFRHQDRNHKPQAQKYDRVLDKAEQFSKVLDECQEDISDQIMMLMKQTIVKSSKLLVGLKKKMQNMNAQNEREWGL